MTFGEKLSRLRKESNFTQEQLADILHVSRQSVSKWESNTAYPETDKLIALAGLFRCTTDYLLLDSRVCKDGGHLGPPAGDTSTIKQTQKIVGYILLAVSPIAGILSLLLANSAEELYFSVTFTLFLLICSLLCLFVRQKAGYWCVWAASAAVTVVLPHLINFTVLVRVQFVFLSFYGIMFFTAKNLFGNNNISTGRKKSFLIVLGWILWIGLRLCSYRFVSFCVMTSGTGAFPFVALNLFIHTGTAFGITYSARYVSSSRPHITKSK